MMRKIISIILILAVSLTLLCGCEKRETASSIGTENSSLNEDSTQEQVFLEDQVLFMAQDRCDIDGDRFEVYYYNYKGEPIETIVASGNVGCFAKNGLAPALYQETNRMGYVDKTGEFKIEPKYENAAPFSEDGIALVQISTVKDGETFEKCGYINSKGKEITPCIYDKATSFYDCGYALAAIYKEIDDGYGNIVGRPWKQCIINKKGDVVVEIDTIAEHRTISKVYENYFVCSSGDLYTIYDYSDNKLAEVSKNESYLDNDYILNYLEGKFNGEKFEPYIYESDIFFEQQDDDTKRNGIAYGISKNDKIVVECKYDYIEKAGEYFVAINYNGYDQILDIYDKNLNKTAENLNYDFYSRYKKYGEECALPSGYFYIYVDNDDYGSVYGIIDETGEIIVPPIFGRGIRLCTYEGTAMFDWE